MTPAAYERLQIRIPLAIAAAAAWVAVAALSREQELVAFCNSDVWTALSLDRLALALTFYSPGRLAGEWMLMVAAMMMPMLAGAVGHIRARSLPRRRKRSLALFMIGYWAIWGACSIPIVLAMLTLQLMQLSPVVTIALVGSLVLVWQFSPAKQFCLNRCHDQPPLAAFGIAADLAALRYGVTQAIWCCGTCWALMLVPLTAQDGHLLAMAATSAYLLAERLDQPRRPAWEIRWPSTIARLLWFRLDLWRRPDKAGRAAA
jgi:predicted metal-binding membrane protein